MKRILQIVFLLLSILPVQALEDYQNKPEYMALRDSMRNAFNAGDSARFFPALSRLEDYLLKQDDQHAYYTQRCNEIVFQMNRQRIFEAYKLARLLTKELQDHKLDDEMYMAYNMLGHLNRYCGNKSTAKQLFSKVVDMMEKSGYYESMPPIYMNIVSVEQDDDPEEARVLLDKALKIAMEYAPDRVFDIETRKTLNYYYENDMERFKEGYKKYREGVAEGKSSVNGRSLEVFYQASLGNVEQAVEMARRELGEGSSGTLTMIYERAGLWKEAFKSLKSQMERSDSVNNVILSNSMQNFGDELKLYDIERKASKTRIITLAIIILLLILLIMAMFYITFTRRRHMKQLQNAYSHALESDKMKTIFIKNMSHEVRTPLNVISGFAQVLANPELSSDAERRKEMAQMVSRSTNLITNQIDELLILSLNEASGDAPKDDLIELGPLLTRLVTENQPNVKPDVVLRLQNDVPNDFTFKSNENMLERIINALIDNALKNTTKGSVLLQAKLEEDVLKLTVEDTGCGIPVKEVERIFERFYKLDSFKSGLGLGLSISRVMATRLGGNVTLDTNYRNGARFVVTLPV